MGLLSDWSDPGSKPRRTFNDKFREAYRGLKKGIRGQSSFFVHFFFAVMAMVAAVVLDCTLIEWCLLVICIGGVLTAELFNSAIETLFKGLDEASRNRWHGCLDIAAGAVLAASITAAVVGILIFGRHLLKLFA